MAKRQVSFLIGANISNFTKGLNKAQKKFKKFGSKMDRMGSSMLRNFSAPLAGIGGLALKSSADFEEMEQSLSILNGSAKEGARIFNELKTLSSSTPFQISDLSKAQQSLQGFGLGADEAIDSIKMLGDISAVTGGDLQSIAVAFGQSSAEGKLMTKDIRQFINQGVPAVKLLSESMGVAKDEIFDLASAGEISFDDLQQSFRMATSEGGLFADGMQKQSNTLKGIFSTLFDNISIGLGELGDSLVKTFDLKTQMKNVISFIKRVVEGFKDLSAQTKRTAFIIAGVLGSAGPIAIAIGALSTVIGSLMSPITLVIGAIAGIVVVGNWVYDNWSIIVANLKKLWAGLTLAVARMVEKSLGFFAGMFKDVLSWMATASNAVGMTGLGEGFLKGIVKIDQGMQGLKETTDEARKNLQKSKEDATKAEDAYVSFGESLSNLGGIISQTFGELTGFSLGAPSTEQTGLSTKSVPTSDEGVSDGEIKPIDVSGKTVKGIKNIGDALGNMKRQAVDLSNALQNTVNQAFAEFGETIGNIFTGDAGARNFFHSILMIAVDFAKQLGKIMIGIGTASLALKSTFANPFAAIAAGTALIALSSVAKNMLQSGPAEMATGGIVPEGFGGDTYPALLSSGEMVVPKPHSLPNNIGGGNDVNVSGEFRVKGTDLVMVLEKAQNKTLR